MSKFALLPLVVRLVTTECAVETKPLSELLIKSYMSEEGDEDDSDDSEGTDEGACAGNKRKVSRVGQRGGSCHHVAPPRGALGPRHFF